MHASPKEKYKAPSVALTAGALQDHIMNELAIGNLSLDTTLKLKSYSGLKERLKNDERKRRTALKNIKPTVDTGRRKKVVSKEKDIEPDEEYVLDPLPKPSLAQKLGLVPHPDKPLTTDEWMSVKQRSIAREDFKNPCAICQEQFRTEDQVLLSCSHVFHKACIQAFEKFTGRKTCPMCRKIQYQARVVFEGTKEYKIRAAIMIQSLWRGYVVRKWYTNLRRTVPPKNPKLRKRFYEEKLKQITDRMVAMTNAETVDRFLQDIDVSVASSRRIFKHFEDACSCRLTDDDWVGIEVKAIERGDNDCPICLRSLRNDRSDTHKTRKTLKKPLEIQECSKSLRFEATRQIKESKSTLSLLSCSHLFHSQCLLALEEYYAIEYPAAVFFGNSVELPTTTNQMNFRCPVCRSPYIKRDISYYVDSICQPNSSKMYFVQARRPCSAA